MLAPKTILIVEDDPTSLETMGGYFEVEGYRVVRASDSTEMERALARHRVDLIVLDLRLPGKDGLTLLRELRSASDLPVIVVSARTDDIDHIVALEIGADDYLDKPVNLRELLVRTSNILRRYGAQSRPGAKPAQPTRVEFAGWTLDNSGRRLFAADGTDVHLTRGEFELLSYFTERAGQVLERDQLLDRLSSREWNPYDRSVDVLVGRLRAKIEEDPKDPRLIVTVHGIGYVFLGTTGNNLPQ
jgi:DNA-binding response OmpR family regulator